MRFYLISDKGNVVETGDAGYGLTFRMEELELSHPGLEVMEISEKEYEKTKDNLGEYKVKDKKVVSKSKSEKDKQGKDRNKWANNNTIDGLRARIESLEAMIK